MIHGLKKSIEKSKPAKSAKRSQSWKREQGKKLESEDIKSLQPHGFVHRLYDTQDWQAKCPVCKHENKNLMAQKQPGDLFFLSDFFFTIECKSSMNPLYFPPKNVSKDHQFTMGMDIISNGGYHAFHIAFYEKNKSPKFSYLIDPFILFRLREERITVGNYKLPWSVLKKHSILVERNRSKWHLYESLKDMVFHIDSEYRNRIEVH